MSITTINPATGETLQSYERMSKDQAFAIASSVQVAQKSWAKLGLAERKPYFLKLAAVLREHKQRFAESMTREMGKVISESLGEVEKCAWLCEMVAEHGESWLREEEIAAGGKKHVVTFDPIGTVLLVMPWNYPFWQPFKVAIPPLFAGDAIILKHASNVTGSALLVEEAFKLAGFPQDLFRTIVTGHNVIGELIDSDYVQAVSLTGSTGAGARIAERAGKNVKKVVLELGGSDPLIVLDDADLDKAAAGATLGRLSNAGQVCISSKRIIVLRSVAEEFSKKYAEHFAAVRVGDPMNPEVKMGPLVDARAIEEMETFVRDALEKGARVLFGGKRLSSEDGEGIADRGHFFAPTLLAGTSSEMEAVREEVFGPIAPIIIVDSEEEAVRVANDSPYGLSASVWTKDHARGERVARQIESGGVFVNSISRTHALIPVGGIKKSGFGRELSHYGIKEFVNIKTISIYD